LTKSLSVASVVGAQEPRVRLVPPYVSSAGVEAIEVADVAGLFLDPWEKLVLTDALGETDAGRWAAYRVGLEVARQNGKGAVLAARELAGLFAFGERLIIHSAHEQATATEHFRRMLNLMEGVPEFDRRVLKAVRGKGSESIELRDGFRIFFKTRTGGGGRGFTGNLVVFDEAMMLAAAFMAALVPTMAAMSINGDPQLWFAGSAVDQSKHEHGWEFARVRADALAGVERLAYFGWNAPYEHPDEVPAEALDDPAVWSQANPGLGIRISPQYVADERLALGEREFCVERLGVGDWPDPAEGSDRIISDEEWRTLEDRESKRSGAVCFTYDVSPDGGSAAIAVAGHRDDGLEHVEIVDHRAGTGWLVDRLVQLSERHSPEAVQCDGQNRAATKFAAKLSDQGVAVDELDAGEHAEACSGLLEAVQDRTFRHLGTPELKVALRGAGKRPLGDSWAWSRRKSSVDISPLVAFTLALRKAEIMRESVYEDRGLLVLTVD
jgi:hypothetical protein